MRRLRACDVIRKKRDGFELDGEEVRFIVHGFARGDIPDYQMAAFLMAVYFRGMTPEETARLTTAMVESGETVDLSAIDGRKVDKHSTGGVGDKTSLVLGPMVASTGVPVPKMSGRGLGHTGGTLDKLESIPGFRVSLSREEFVSTVRRVGIAIAGQTGRLVPADGRMYALRDVTATVDSVPLIASSVMSKKMAGGADAIVLDVKFGSGAFMKTMDDAVSLARAMVRIGGLVGRETTAVISSMEQPLGLAVGNALEVREAIETLSGRGPLDLVELCLEIGSLMLTAAGRSRTRDEGRDLLKEALASGRALRKLADMIEAQGGDARVIDDPSLLPAAPVVHPVPAWRSGFVEGIDALGVGMAAMVMGAGRATKDSTIDHAVGVVLCRKTGDAVESGQPLAFCHLRDRAQEETAVAMVERAFRISDTRPSKSPLVRAVVTREGVEHL